MSLAGKRFLALLAEDVSGSVVRDALPPTAPLRIVDLRDATERVPQLVDETAPDLVLVGCTRHSDAALHVIREVHSRRPDTPIVILYDGNPNGFMDPAFKAGAEDLLTLPQPATQLAFAFEKVIARRRGNGGQQAEGAMIAVLGPKGGTGKTMTSCNLAVALARKGARPAIVDIDLQFGDVGLALGMRPERTIYDLAVAGGSLDAEKVDSFLLEHESGVRALLAPSRPDQAAAIEIPFLRKVIELLRTGYDFVIVDTPPVFSPEVIAAIDMASDLCVVGMLDALSLKDTKIGFQTLQQMGYDPADTVLVLNRADTSVGITHDDVRRLLDKEPDVLVPSDRAVPRALTAGQVIVDAGPRSGPARAFTALAERYLVSARSTAAGVDQQSDAGAPRRRALLRKGR